MYPWCGSRLLVASALIVTQSITSPSPTTGSPTNNGGALELARIELETIFNLVEINKTGTKPKQ
jgi:hypothetical protein